MTLIVNVVAIGRKSGKTSLIKILIQKLTEKGYSICTIKHISKGIFDTKQKDTWKHLQVGAHMVVAVTKKELVTIKKIAGFPLDSALTEVNYSNFDLIIIEGFKNSIYPKIVVAKNENDAKKLLSLIKNSIAITGPIIGKYLDDIPILNPFEIMIKLEQMIIENKKI